LPQPQPDPVSMHAPAGGRDVEPMVDALAVAEVSATIYLPDRTVSASVSGHGEHEAVRCFGVLL